MPKDWKGQKAEIQRLYMVEGRPLKEVRDYLSNERGFKASTRAYRMKLDGWGFRKYKSAKNVQLPKRGSLQMPSVKSAKLSMSPAKQPDAAMILIEDGPQPKSIMGVSLPARLAMFFDSSGLSNTPYIYDDALEILVSNWQPDDAYLQDALFFLRNLWQIVDIGRPAKDGSSIFYLMDVKVPLEQRAILVKECLRGDRRLHRSWMKGMPPIYPAYLQNWVAACGSSQWDAAKKLLYENKNHVYGTNMNHPGESFLSCALVVIAEGLLTDYKLELERLRDDVGSSDFFSDELKAFEYCKAYITILKDFRQATLDVDPSWYKYSVQISEWIENIKKGHQEKALDSAEKGRDKYQQIKNLYTKMMADQNRDVYKALTENITRTTDTWTSISKIIEDDLASENNLTIRSSSPAPQLKPTGYSRSFASALVPTQTTLKALNVLVEKWKTDGGAEFGMHVQTIMREDGSSISILEPTTTGENLLNLASNLLPDKNMIPFIKALIQEIYVSRSLSRERRSYTLHEWWESMRSSKSLDELRVALRAALLAQNQVIPYLKLLSLSLKTINLFLNCSIYLAYESFLTGAADCLNRYQTNVDIEFPPPTTYLARRHDYITALDLLRSEDVEVDRHRFEFLLDILQWEEAYLNVTIELS